MSYLINATKPVSLTIGGTDYVANLLSFQVSDSSSFRNGIVTTTGTLELGSLPGQSLEDYDRNDFQRGSEIHLQVTYPDGSIATHPRGRMLVISASYSPESEVISLDIGCKLTLLKLIDDEDAVEALINTYVEIPLDPAQEDFESLASSIAASTKVMWVDSANAYQKENYFGSDNFGQYEPGAFVSVRGVTALQVEPLAATAAIPDELELSYQFPENQKAGDNQGRVDTTTTTSKYFLRYPAITYERQKPEGPLSGSVDIDIPPVTIPPIPIPVSGCGNTPGVPGYKPSTQTGGGSVGGDFTIQVPSQCSQGYQTVAAPTYIPAVRQEVRSSTYGGPSAQVSVTTSEVRGPALEANSQYFADKYAYCTSVYANQCLPNGGCELVGTGTIRLGRQTTVYQYGPANEVVKTITSTFRPTLAAAQPSDWRSGSNRGIPQDFNPDLSLTKEYLHQAVVRTFKRSNNENIQHTITYTSTASRGGGIGANLNAYAGIKTEEIRKSVSTVTNDLRPDSVNAATTAVDTNTTKVSLHGQVGGYVGNNGPYIVKEDVPVPLLLDTKSAVKDAANQYGDYLARFVEGDARGLVIGESLRKEIADAWKPNMPFRYYDPATDKFMAFRADACSWGVDNTGCVVAINGIWVADLAGSVTIGSNLSGNAEPDMSGANDPTPPTHGVTEPIVDDEDVINKRFNFYVNVYLSMGATMTPSGIDGIRYIFSGREDFDIKKTFVMWCTGRVVQPGALVTLENDGSLPLSANGQPIVDEALIVNDDIFATP